MHAATKQYVDATTQGLDVKNSVRLASTGNLTIADINAGDTIDGVSLVAGNRILLKDQTAASENGIYTVSENAGGTVRSADMAATDQAAGIFVFVEEGNASADSGFVCTSDGSADTVGTHNLTFAQFSGAGQITAGTALTKTGNTLNVAVDSSTIEVAGDALQIKNSGVVTGKINDNAVTTGKINNDAVTFAKIQNVAANSILIRNANSSGDLSELAIANTQIMIGDGDGMTSAALSGDATMSNTGVVTIADNSINADKLANNAVDTAAILDANVTFAKIQNVSANSLLVRNANSAGVASELSLASTQIMIGNGAGMTAAALSGDITMTNAGVVTIANSSIETSMIAADAVDGTKIADDAIGNEHIADNAVRTAHIQDAQVTNAKLANSSLTIGGTTIALGATAASLSSVTFVELDQDPASAMHAATKQYVDAKVQGLDIKESVRAASTANVNLATLDAGQALDGVTLAQGDRVLIKNQTTASQNGIYTINADGNAATRASDMAASSEAAGIFVFIEEGTTNSDNGFVCTTNDAADTVGTHDLAFVQFSGAGQITAGTALSKSANTLNVNVDGTTVEVNGSDQLQVKNLGISTAKLANDAVTAAKLADNAVDTASIVDLNVTTGKIAANAVTAAKLADNAVDTAAIVDVNVTTAKLADNSVTAAKLADNAVDTAAIVDANVTFAKIQNVSGNSLLIRNAAAAGVMSELTIGDAQIMVGDNSGMNSVSLSGDITMTNAGVVTIANTSVETSMIAADAIDSTKIADDAIGNEHIADNAVRTAHIQDSQVTNAKLANSALTVGTTSISLGTSSTTLAGIESITLTQDPASAMHAATKQYVDATAQGIDVKDSVRAGTTASFTMASTASATTLVLADSEGGFNATADTLTIDGISLSQNDRILIKDGVNSNSAGVHNKWNGIYTVGALNGTTLTLTRAADSVQGKLTPGCFTFIEQGSVNADNGYVCTTDGTITIGTTAVEFTQFSGAGQITAGSALTKSGNTLNVAVDGTTIEVNSDALRIVDDGVTAAKIATNAVTSDGLADNAVDTTSIADSAVTNVKLANSSLTLAQGAGMAAMGSVSLGGTVTVAVDGNLEDLDTLGAVGAANKMVKSTGAGAFEYIDFKDEDNMASDSANSVASQQSIKAYVDSQVGGSTATIGAAESGDNVYTDGLFTDFVPATTVGTAVDRFNEILKLLVPTPAPQLDDIDYNNTTVAKDQVVTANLSFGAANNQSSATPAYISVGGTAVGAVDVNGSYTTAANGNHLRAAVFDKTVDVTGDLNEDIAINQTTPSDVTNYPANSFGDANIGSLILEVNGADLLTLDLTDGSTGAGASGNGSGNHYVGGDASRSGFVNLSAATSGKFDNNTSFDQFKHRTGQWKVGATDQRNGWNYVRVKHSKGGSVVTTNYVEWVCDNNSDALAASSNSLSFTGNAGTTVALSGVDYFTQATATYAVDVDHAYKYVYDSNNISFPATVPGSGNVVVGIAAIAKPAINTGGGETHTKQLELSETGNVTADFVLNDSITVGVTVTHPLKANITNAGQSSQNQILMYSLTNNSTDTLETFRRENYRIINETYATQASVPNGSNAWNSETHMLDGNAGHNDGLQFYNQRLYSPKNTTNSGNFSTLSNGPVGNPNYSGITGNRTFYRRFRNTSGSTVYNMKLEIQGSGTIVSNGTALNGDKFKVHIKYPNNVSQGTDYLDLTAEFVLGDYGADDGAHTANGALSFDSSLNATNYIVLGTAGVENNEYVVVRITADDSWTGYVSQMEMTFGAGTGAVSATPNLSRIDADNTAAGVNANLSFGSSKAIGTHTNVSTTAGFSASDNNDLYAVSTSGNNFRRGCYTRTVGGGGLPVIEGDLNFNVGAASPDYSAMAFSDANKGTLKLVVNGAEKHSVALTGAYNAVGAGNPGSGTDDSRVNANGSGFVDLSVWKPAEFDNDIPHYLEIYRTAKFRVKPEDMVVGWNYARVVHTVDGVARNTNYVEWVCDDNTTNPAVVGSAALAAFTDDTLNYLSGVKYFTQPKGVYSVTVSNLYKSVYSDSNNAISFANLSNATGVRVQQSGAGLSAAKDTAAAIDSFQTLSNVANSQNENITVQGTVQFSQSKSLPGTYTTAHGISAAMTFDHPLLTNLTTATLSKSNMLVYTVSNTSNANTNEHFTSETYRVQQGNYTTQASVTAGSNAWNSQTSIESGAGHNKGLLIYDGMVMSPLDGGISGDFRNTSDGGSIEGPSSNVNYSSLTNATREFYRGFLNNTENDMPRTFVTLYGDATIVPKTGTLGSNKNIFVELKIPGQTGWMDLGSAVGASGVNGDGAGAFYGSLTSSIVGGGTQNEASFAGATIGGTSSAQQYLMVKISAHKDWSGYLSRINVSWTQS